jgi:hypothetical protein
VLRQARGEAGSVDGGGRPEAHQLHPHQRPLLLARCAEAGRAAPVWQELPPALDKLPPPRPQAGAPNGRRGAARHRPPRQARQQVTDASVCHAHIYIYAHECMHEFFFNFYCLFPLFLIGFLLSFLLGFLFCLCFSLASLPNLIETKILDCCCIVPAAEQLLLYFRPKSS